MKPLLCTILLSWFAATSASAAAEPPALLAPGQGTPPKPVHRVRPIFPYNMQAAGLEGMVTIEFVVDTAGRVQDPSIVRSNNPWFERPAIEALNQWRFEPAVVDGRTVATRMKLPIKFSLSERGSDLWTIRKGSNHASLPPEMQWDEPPEAINTAFPVYPFQQLREKTNATFNVGMIIDREGRVVATTLPGDAPPEFAGAARAMAAMWQFKPARKKNGEPCHALIVIAQEFRSDGRGTVPVSNEAKEILRELARPKPRISTLEELDAPPKDFSFREIVYPRDLQAQGVQGDATIEYFIDRNGDVQLPRIVSSSHEEFGYYAAMAAACWRYEPPRKDGKPVIVRAQRVVKFSVNE